MAKKEKIGYTPTGDAYTRDVDAWFIVLLIAIPFCFPFALYLMWRRTKWKTWVKILVTSLVLLQFLSLIVTGILESGAAGAGAETTAAVAAFFGVV